jgi:hypothetical protein
VAKVADERVAKVADVSPNQHLSKSLRRGGGRKVGGMKLSVCKFTSSSSLIVVRRRVVVSLLICPQK